MRKQRPIASPEEALKLFSNNAETNNNRSDATNVKQNIKKYSYTLSNYNLPCKFEFFAVLIKAPTTESDCALRRTSTHIIIGKKMTPN